MHTSILRRYGHTTKIIFNTSFWLTDTIFGIFVLISDYDMPNLSPAVLENQFHLKFFFTKVINVSKHSKPLLLIHKYFL